MYSKSRNIIIGFHGCDESVRDSIVSCRSNMEFSTNDYDWLGHGMYFWENNEERALQFAQESSKIKTPAVLGAFIDLDYCLDLIDSKYLPLLQIGYQTLKDTLAKVGESLPKNGKGRSGGDDLLVRKLDCAVIETVHGLQNPRHSYDSVRGVFWEGEDLYTNAGFKEKNHIQICIRNPNCIKGFFIPRELK